MKYLVSYSGGIGSFWAAKKLVDQYGKENVVAIFTDTNWEDEDLYRFIDESIAHLGIDLIYLEAPCNPMELAKKEKVIYNSRMASCSRILKMRLQYSFILQRKYKVLGDTYNVKDLILCGEEYYGKINPNNFTMVLGIDWTEAQRTGPILKNWKEKHGFNVVFPLVDDLTYSKDVAFDYLRDNNIHIPRLYTLGFAHNNCGGRCFKAGQGHFKILFEKMPYRFDELSNYEKEFRESTGKDYSIMTKMRKGVKMRYTLEMLKEDYLEENDIDLQDIGGCGCFVDSDMDDEL